jgi:DNA-directed RNA polymerase specialized sigma subunit
MLEPPASCQHARKRNRFDRIPTGKITQLLPLLGEAMGALSETDRNTILLRFFAKKNLSEVGAAMGISDGR